MAYGGYNYLELDYQPDLNNDILVWHWVKGQRTLEKLAEAIAAESSVGTWTEVATELKDVWERLHARVFEADKKTGFLKIAYPLALFELGNIPQLLSSVAGNVYGLKEISSLKLLDLLLPEKYNLIL